MRRAARKWVTSGATALALRAAPWLGASGPARVGRLLARTGRRVPRLRRMVAANMRAAGVESPAAVDGYFEQVGQHLAAAIQALRCGPATPADALHHDFAAEMRRRIDVSHAAGTLGALRGRGAVIVGPHICGYLLSLAAVNEHLPLTVYLRHTADGQRLAAKQRWYAASRVRWICEPRGVRPGAGRLGAMVAAVQAGQAMYITPDLPQKLGQGVPVRCGGVRLELPAGAALLALRTRAPLYALLAEADGERQRLVLRGPYEGAAMERGRTARQAAVGARMQWFARLLEEFIRSQPALWYLWADKRWTRVFRRDPRFVPPMNDSGALPAAPGD